jgi:hypothetical protein
MDEIPDPWLPCWRRPAPCRTAAAATSASAGSRPRSARWWWRKRRGCRTRGLGLGLSPGVTGFVGLAAKGGCVRHAHFAHWHAQHSPARVVPDGCHALSAGWGLLSLPCSRTCACAFSPSALSARCSAARPTAQVGWGAVAVTAAAAAAGRGRRGRRCTPAAA